MKKIAIFVEGYTEQVFVERLAVEIAGSQYVSVEAYTASGGRKKARSLTLITARKTYGTERYYVMIVNSGTDGRVASDVNDQYSSLVSAGYTSIIAVRDVYPSVARHLITKLRSGLSSAVPTTPITPLFILGIMEIETWFLSEHRHFLQISPALTPARIQTDFGIDVVNADLQLRNHPTEDLHNIYATCGCTYSKSLVDINRSVGALSMEAIYLETRSRIPDLNRLLSELDAFFS